MPALAIPDSQMVVSCLVPAADAGGRTGDYVNVGEAQRVFVCCYLDQGAANTVKFDILEATTNAGGGAQAIAKTMPLWTNQDTAATSAMTRQTDAADFTTSAAVKPKLVVFQLDPAILSDGFKFVAVRTGASAAANITSAFLVVEGRYGTDSADYTA